MNHKNLPKLLITNEDKKGGQRPPCGLDLEDQLVGRQLIQLCGRTASLTVRAGSLGSGTYDLTVLLGPMSNHPVIGSELSHKISESERLRRKREALEHSNCFLLTDALADIGGNGRAGRGGVIRIHLV